MSLFLLFVLSLPPVAHAADAAVKVELPARQLAFARYTGSLFERDPFTESGPVAVFISASLPSLYKDSELVAIRDTNAEEKAEYRLLYLSGDATVEQQVVPRYFGVREVLDRQRVSSILITPTNYKFHFRRELRSGSNSTFVYDIKPRKRRRELVHGQLWIDGGTGIGVLLKGRIKDQRGAIEFVCETQVVNGSPAARVTNAKFSQGSLGRAELRVVEYPVTGEAGEGR